jgi:hypothetical protein
VVPGALGAAETRGAEAEAAGPEASAAEAAESEASGTEAAGPEASAVEASGPEAEAVPDGARPVADVVTDCEDPAPSWTEDPGLSLWEESSPSSIRAADWSVARAERSART